MALFSSRRQEEQQFLSELKNKTLFEATRFIQEIITNQDIWGPDEVARRQRLLEDAQAGDPEAADRAVELVVSLLEKYDLQVEGMEREAAAYEIYKYAWGLDVLEELYRDATVDEIRVNGPHAVYIQRQGKNEKTSVKFKDEEHVKKIAGRLFIHDRGVSLTASTPVAESIRKDGTRVTATCPPVTSVWTLVLRKHDTFKMTWENLIRAGTANEQILSLLRLLVRGRANIMFSGGTGTGKTSLLRYCVGFLPEALRIVTMENDRELRLAEHYPDRDIVEMEEHPDLGYPMSKLFRTTLRYSPDVIIVGEVRGHGEATEAVKACTKGHDGSMVTIHFGSPEEAIVGYAKMTLEEGMNLPMEIAMTWVAQAFNVIVQMFADSTRGVKKITRITEVWEDGKIHFRDLAVWLPSPDDYFRGRWSFPNSPSERLLKEMQRYGVQAEEVQELYRQAERAVFLS